MTFLITSLVMWYLDARVHYSRLQGKRVKQSIGTPHRGKPCEPFTTRNTLHYTGEALMHCRICAYAYVLFLLPFLFRNDGT